MAKELSPNLRLKIESLPDSPGCYLMKCAGEIIYVGKAKNLKNRVRQYFHPSKSHTPKVEAMVEKIDDFDIVLVDGELEAFILECNLIKLHMPRYNILLKDDKHYPYIRVDREKAYPTLDLVRRQEKDGAKYFGPYQGATVVREVLDVARMVFPVRTCAWDIRPDRPRRPCVHYEIGQCLAPCAGKTTPEAYDRVIQKAMDFLGGRYAPVLDELHRRMDEAAQSLNYERAAVYRDRITAVEAVMQKQKAISTAQGDRDVIACLDTGDEAMVQLMMIRSGRLIGSEHFPLEGAGGEMPGEVLTQFMLQYYSADNPPPQEVLASADPPEKETLEQLLTETAGRRIYILRPLRGEKAKLVQMAMKNARDEAEKRRKRLSGDRTRTQGALQELARVLNLAGPPRRIEGYDISNTQGVLSVGSEVVMLEGRSANREYRHFRIKTVEGPNDFASMHEVLTRRLSHGLREIQERKEQGLPPEGGRFSDLPDLILIDGGRGQLSAAQDAMHAQGLSIPMFGLAKRIEEIVLPDQEDSILLDRHSPALHMIQRLRDEAHRFAITHHRALRGRQSTASRLETVPGVGEKRRKAILNHFRTVEALNAATAEEIAQVPGVPGDVAQSVFLALHPPEPAPEDAGE